MIKIFNSEDRIELKDFTIEKLIEELNKFPKETIVHTNGIDTMYIHVDKRNGSICIDSDDLDCIYFEQDLAEERCGEAHTPCSSYEDYSPSNPWSAPGMHKNDFIRC